MSKCDPLWAFVQRNGGQQIKLNFGKIHEIIGFEIDHSF